jgi:hypothetical protein
MARRSGYTLIEASCGVTANGNRSALTPLRIAAHRCTRIESLPSPSQMIENCALDLYEFGSTTPPTSEGGLHDRSISWSSVRVQVSADRRGDFATDVRGNAHIGLTAAKRNADRRCKLGE